MGTMNEGTWGTNCKAARLHAATILLLSLTQRGPLRPCFNLSLKLNQDSVSATAISLRFSALLPQHRCHLEAPRRMPQGTFGKVGSWSLNNSVLNTFDFEPDGLQCLMVLYGLPKVTGVQWNPGGPLGQTLPSLLDISVPRFP